MQSRTIQLHQHKYPLQRISDERMEEMKVLLDSKDISVYCDCSLSLEQPLIGLSACYVGGGSAYTESSKIYTKEIGKNIFGELLAVKFAAMNIPRMLNTYSQMIVYPKKINLFSDCHSIEDMIYNGAGKKQYMKEVVADIQRLLLLVPDYIDVQIKYLGEQKTQNIYHKAAHNASRKVIGKK